MRATFAALLGLPCAGVLRVSLPVTSIVIIAMSFASASTIAQQARRTARFQPQIAGLILLVHMTVLRTLLYAGTILPTRLVHCEAVRLPYLSGS